MLIERLEQIAAVVVTAGLVAGNFFLFTPWRSGHDPRDRRDSPQISQPKQPTEAESLVQPISKKLQTDP
jgi:hypothetical protein